MGGQKSTQNESGIFWKGESDLSQDKEKENPSIGKMVY
jgi:hypothetical protein